MQAIRFENLPPVLPVFPLPRVILLPRVTLPLNIFEPRYLAMVDAALAGDRLIGMVQPGDGGDSLSATGCAGRIASYEETDDGRYLVSLRGVCRFDVAGEEPPAAGGFRRVRADWSRYAGDFDATQTTDICRESMMRRLKDYLDGMGLSCDQWQQMRQMECDRLISTLSVICPFDAAEKQALLEAPALAERARILFALLDAAKAGGGETCH